MNTAATTLLRSLDTLGVQSLRFRVLGLGQHLRHTTPVAQSEDQPALRLPNLSISQLFSAYLLTPRRGDYVLEVDNGSLAFIPPAALVAPERMPKQKKRRTVSSRSSRGRRTAYAAAHKLAA